ncbi:hypothetical protein [Streptomyces sp. NPDC026673]|uniref:hypothetical protein n=1 Tax=Streptomyces sp. NPDC026673 TaxID=3155724 RepID=UPI0034076595
MEIVEGELRRLVSGPGPEDDEGLFLVRVRFAAQDPVQVIADVRAVLTCVVERMGDWPALERWPRLLPEWFVQRCEPEAMEPEHGEPFDAEAWLRQWRAMTPEQRKAAGRGAWTLSDWLHHFDPTEEGAGDDRSWWWWHADTDESGGWVQVATTGWPFGSGSLSWLIKAGGGTDLVYGP